MENIKNTKNIKIISDIPFDFNIDYSTTRTPYSLTEINNNQEIDNSEQLFLKKNLSHGKITKYIFDRNIKNSLYESQNCSNYYKKQSHRSHSPSIQSLIYYRPINRLKKNITEKNSRIQSIIINTEKLKRVTSPTSQIYIYKKKTICKQNNKEKLKTIKISENALNEISNNSCNIQRINSFQDKKNILDDDMTLKEFLMKETESIKSNHPNMQLSTLYDKNKDNSENGYNSYNSETNKTNYTQIDNVVKPYSVKLFVDRKIKKIPKQNKNSNTNNLIKKYTGNSVINNSNGKNNSKNIVKYSSFRQNNNKSGINNDPLKVIKKETHLLKNTNKKRVPCKIKDSSNDLGNKFKINKIFSTSLTNINTNINAFFYSPSKIITKVSDSMSNKNKNIIKRIKINHSSSDLAKYKCKVIDLHKFRNNPLKRNNSFSNERFKNIKQNILDEDKPLFTIRIKISDLVNQLNKIKKNEKLKRNPKININ